MIKQKQWNSGINAKKREKETAYSKTLINCFGNLPLREMKS